MTQPEKLNLWDRIFNRYRKEIFEKGTENWIRCPMGFKSSFDIKYSRDFIKYKIIHRVTGSETIKKEYLN